MRVSQKAFARSFLWSEYDIWLLASHRAYRWGSLTVPSEEHNEHVSNLYASIPKAHQIFAEAHRTNNSRNRTPKLTNSSRSNVNFALPSPFTCACTSLVKTSPFSDWTSYPSALTSSIFWVIRVSMTAATCLYAASMRLNLQYNVYDVHDTRVIGVTQ